MSEPRYVYDGNIDKLSEAVGKLNRRAEKLGVPAIQLHIGEREICFTCPDAPNSSRDRLPAVSTDPKVWGPEAKPVAHERATVVLVGEPPMLNGYTFAAVVDHLSNGTITSYPGSTLDLKPFRGVEATCDHCKTARKRHETFIVVHATGIPVRVGRSCLRDFLGHSNPTSLIGHLNLYGKAFALIEGFEQAGFDTGPTFMDLPVFLGFVAAQMRTHGWCSKSRAFAEGHYGATADVAAHAYWTAHSSPVLVPTAEDAARGVKAQEWARALTDAEIGDSDYLFNLRAVCTDDFIRPKRTGIAASVIVAAERAFEKIEREAREAASPNLHVGAVKERLTLELCLVNLREIDGYYGPSYLHTFADPAGNCLIWFATNPDIIPEGTGKRRMVVGESCTLSGTVKGHDDYRGKLQTKLTRVSVPKPKKTPKNKRATKTAKKAEAKTADSAAGHGPGCYGECDGEIAC